jgi:Sigma-70 factor, region 1.2
MNIAELGTIEIIETPTVDIEEPSLEILEAVADEELLITDNDERDGDQMGAARPSGYNKTEHDDAVGAFFKEMARYPLLKPDEEVELARRVRFLEEVRELQASLQKDDRAAIRKSLVPG